MTRISSRNAAVLADPAAQRDPDRLHAILTGIRAEEPVAWVDVPGYTPFWAITRHEDILAIERDHRVFRNSPRPVLMTAEADEIQASYGIATLIHLDDPRHRLMRAIGADWFRPKAMRAMNQRIDVLAKRYVDEMLSRERCDFVQDVAVHFPLYVIMSLLGVPESDFPLMLRLTQQMFGADDDEMKRDEAGDGMDVLVELFTYFRDLTTKRRAHPTDDLASAIANAVIDGEPLDDIESMSYYAIIAGAGHDTTSATISGGLQALAERPDQLARLRADPSLLPSAVEEMIRWVTPVKAFMRTAAEDTTVRGVKIDAGDSLLLSYVSANRDEGVFSAPFTFDISRERNAHVSFGFGVHFCLGAALARMEVLSFFAELLPRLKFLELDGIPEFVATTFAGGLKHLPVRYAAQ